MIQKACMHAAVLKDWLGDVVASMGMDGRELVFRPRGAGRFVQVAFLSIWLVAWAVGETFALFLLGHGIWALWTGSPAMGQEEPLGWGIALAVGSFLIVWLSLWTLGGVMAMQEWLRLVWARHRLRVSAGGIELTRQLGPWITTRRLARGDIRRIYVTPYRAVLTAETANGVVELTDLGRPEQMRAAESFLRAALQLREDDAVAIPSVPPAGWQEIVLPRGQRALVQDLKTRHIQALLLSGVAAVVSLVAWMVLRESLRDPDLLAVAAMLCVAAAWLVWKAIGLHRGRKEWRLEAGKLVLQRRFGSRVTAVLGEATALELIERVDTDDDRWYQLEAVGQQFPAKRRRGRSAGKPETARKEARFTLTQTLSDPTEPRHLGLWLSQRIGVSFTDRVSDAQDRAAEIAELRQTLSSSGRFGRFLDRLLSRVVEKQGRRGM
jgi:hypothetical protein